MSMYWRAFGGDVMLHLVFFRCFGEVRNRDFWELSEQFSICVCGD